MDRDDDDADYKVTVMDCRIIAATPKAIKVVMPGRALPVWIPQAAVHDDSQIWRDGDRGDLVLKGWFAERDGIGID